MTIAQPPIPTATHHAEPDVYECECGATIAGADLRGGVPAGSVLVLRTSAADGTSRNGFQWPESGPVEAPDWSPVAECGRGLHGALWGEGDGSLFSWDADARWIVVEVVAADIVDLVGKVKFPRGVVVFNGDRLGATTYLAQRAGRMLKIVGGTATAGDGGTATAGDGGTATAGYGGTATAGDGGTATAGDGGTATAGDGGTATAGYGGTILLRYWDAIQERWRIKVGEIGDGGLVAGKAYKLVDGVIVPAEASP